MGFFSSRTLEDANLLEDDRSVVQVIRSRFYGKYKGKQRETFADVPSPQLLHVGANFSQRSIDRESLSRSSLDRSSHSPMRPLEASSPRSPPRAHTDAITSTLAQRLDELAVANAEGLLNDEEYRLLRQNIFERLASGASVPAETPVIPLGPHSRSLHEASQLNTDAYTPRQFQAKSHRTPSVRSKSSVSSAVSNLFKRGSSNRRISAASAQDDTISETSSTFSLASLAPSPFKRRTTPLDTRSVSPALKPELRRDHTAMLPQPRADHRLRGASSHRSISRGMRRLGTVTPPSSFPIRNPDPKHHPSILTSDSTPDDEKVKSSRDLRLEIEVMEAEGRRLLDAFNGLELSALTRSQHAPAHPPLPHSPSASAMSRRNGIECSDSFPGGCASGRGTPYHGSDADGVSLRSATSYRTNISQPHSHRPNPSLRTNGPLAVSPAASRKRSMSSLSSRARAPPSSASPALAHGRLAQLGSVSSVNLVRSEGQVSPTDEDSEMTALEAELFDIRRRRQEVTARYQDRLEYLRAQLKGAELREKLLRK